MQTHEVQRGKLQRVLERFPDQATVIRAEALRDQTFRSLCEDLALALVELARLETHPDAARRAEIPEYCTIIGQLEAEVLAYLATAERGDGSDTANCNR